MMYIGAPDAARSMQTLIVAHLFLNECDALNHAQPSRKQTRTRLHQDPAPGTLHNRARTFVTRLHRSPSPRTEKNRASFFNTDTLHPTLGATKHGASQCSAFGTCTRRCLTLRRWQSEMPTQASGALCGASCLELASSSTNGISPATPSYTCPVLP